MQRNIKTKYIKQVEILDYVVLYNYRGLKSEKKDLILLHFMLLFQDNVLCGYYKMYINMVNNI